MKIKKTLALFLVAMLILSALPMSAFATDTTISVDTSQITGTLNPGASFIVPLKLSGNTGFTNCDLFVDYDHSLLELTAISVCPDCTVDECEHESSYASLAFGSTFVGNASTGKISLAKTKAITKNGTVCYLFFTTKGTAAGGTVQITVAKNPDAAVAMRNGTDEVTATFAAGSVTVAADITKKVVTFYGSDLSTPVGTVQVAPGATLVGETLPTVTDTDKIFAGWYTSVPTVSAGATQVTPGTKLDVHNSVTADLAVYPVFVDAGAEVMIEHVDGTIVGDSTYTLFNAIDGKNRVEDFVFSPMAVDTDIIRLVKDITLADATDHASWGGTYTFYDIHGASLKKIHLDLNGHTISAASSSSGWDGNASLFTISNVVNEFSVENTEASGKFVTSFDATGSTDSGLFFVNGNSIDVSAINLNLSNVVVSGTAKGVFYELYGSLTVNMNIVGSTIDYPAIDSSSATVTPAISVGAGTQWNTAKGLYSDMTKVTVASGYVAIPADDGYTKVVDSSKLVAVMKYDTDGKTLISQGSVQLESGSTLKAADLASMETARSSCYVSGANLRSFTFAGWALTADATVPVDLSTVAGGDTLYPIYTYTDTYAPKVLCNGTGYISIAEALTAAESISGTVTIQLQEDVTEFVILTEKTLDVVIDLNGFTLAMPADKLPDPTDTWTCPLFTIKHSNGADAELSITDSSTAKTGNIFITRTDKIMGYPNLFFVSGATSLSVTISGGKFSTPYNKVWLGLDSGTSLSITGGSFSTKIYDNCELTNYVNTALYHTISSGGYYTVAAHAPSTEWTSNELNHWHKCVGCDVKYDEAAHTWDAGMITKPASLNEAGEKTFTCTVCGATKTAPIDQLTGYMANLVLTNVTDRDTTNTNVTDMYAGDSVTVDVKVEGGTYVGADITLSYDSSLFEVTSAADGWDAVTGGYRYIKAYNGNGTFTDGEVLGTFTFKAKVQDADKSGAFEISKAVVAVQWEEAWSSNLANECTNKGISYIAVEMHPMTAVVTEVAGGLTYTGSAQALLTSISTTETVPDLTVKYSNDGGATYTLTDIPTGTDAGDYTVFYQLTAPGYITITDSKEVTINKADIAGYDDTTVTLTAAQVTYDGTAKTPVSIVPASGATTEVTVEYSTDGGNTWVTTTPSFTEVGDYSIKVKVSKANYNDKVIDLGSFTISPLVEISTGFITGYDLVLVFTNGTEKYAYDGVKMYDASALGYKYGTTWGDNETVTAEGTAYTYVYAMVVANASDTKLANSTASVVTELDRGATNLDVNISNKVDLYDYVAVQAVYNVNSSYLSGHLDIVLKADVSGNKKVDTQDVALIKAYMLAH